eukprot:7651395-Heterocapsa_arctica.AAC.1
MGNIMADMEMQQPPKLDAPIGIIVSYLWLGPMLLFLLVLHGGPLHAQLIAHLCLNAWLCVPNVVVRVGPAP